MYVFSNNITYNFYFKGRHHSKSYLWSNKNIILTRSEETCQLKNFKIIKETINTVTVLSFLYSGHF